MADEPTGANPGTQPNTQPGPVPYERFQEVNSRLRDATAKLTELEKQYTSSADQVAQLTREREQERASRLRLEVALGTGLPKELAGRLQGTTQAELEADAETLLALLPGRDAPPQPGVPPSSRGGGNSVVDLNKLSPKEIREKRGELWKQFR